MVHDIEQDDKFHSGYSVLQFYIKKIILLVSTTNKTLLNWINQTKNRFLEHQTLSLT